MKHLENFIQENREAFDNESPSQNLWAAIDNRLNNAPHAAKKQEAKIIQMPIFAQKLRIAASVFGILLCGVAIGFFMKSNSKNDTLASISPEYAEMEKFYQQQIDKKTKQLVSLKNVDNVKSDLSEIDVVMDELRNELTNAPKGSREQIIHNMILSYKNKIDILERVIEKKSNQTDFVQTNFNNSNNEKDSI
jgi:hypothetical protein